MEKSLILTFCLLIAVFLVIVATFFIPAVQELLKGPLLFLLPFFVFFLLGIVLIFLTLKQKVESKLRKFLLLTGASATGFFIFVILHNVFYALAVVTGNITLLKYLMEALHTLFFLLAVLVCPVGFLVGEIGSIIMFSKQRNKK